MLKFFLYISTLSPGRSLACKEGSTLPLPPPPPTPPITFLMILSLSIILLWVLADVLKLILGISRTDVWSQASFLLSPPRGSIWGRGSLIEAGGLLDLEKTMVPLRRFLSEITQPFPSKIRRLATTQGKGGRETWSLCHFVFFLHRRGGHPFLIGLCPKGSLIIKSGETQEQEG